MIGEGGTSVVEFANHLGASAAFAVALPGLRRVALSLSAATIGVAYGTALYAVNIAGIAPLLGITEGEREAGERWAIHVLQAVVTVLAAERLTSERKA